MFKLKRDEEPSGARDTDPTDGSRRDNQSSADAKGDSTAGSIDLPRITATESGARDQPDDVDSRPSVLSMGVTLKGEFACTGPLHIEGAVEGSVRGPQVTVGAAGRIEGEVESARLSLQGHFRGTAVCGTVALGPRAIANGDVTCESMTLARGALLEGRVAIGSPAESVGGSG